jgi:hypothetical protein
MIEEKKNTNVRNGVTAIIFAVCCFAFFQYLIPYHSFFKEQTRLFLYTTDYFSSYWHKPAAPACYIGDFLTQFFYLRYGGALVVTLVLLLEYGLAVRALNRLGVRKQANWIALLPVALECVLHCGLYYSLSNTIAIMLVLLIFLFYIKLPNKWLSLIAGLALVPALYSLSGAAFFLFPLLVIIYEIRKGRWLHWLPLLAISIVYPQQVRSKYLLTSSQAYRYPFTSFSLRGPDINREKILKLATEGYFGNWEMVAKLAEEDKLPNPIATYYTNIALSKQGKLGSELMNYYQPFSDGLFLKVSPESDWLTIFFSSDVFYHLGDMNMAQHSAMLGMTFSPQHRSSRMVKRLAEINLVNGDSTATLKYLRILDATLFHRKWAAACKAMLTDADGASSALQFKRSRIPARDTLRAGDDYPLALNLLIESNTENNDALDYLLCYYLLNKNIPAFAATYNRYCKDKTQFIPRLYSEAILIYLAASAATPQEIESYRIPPQISTDFIEYTRIYEQSNGNPEPLRDTYAPSYWFFYHFAQKK